MTTNIKIPAFKIIQNEIPMLVFITNAKTIYERFDVSRRIDDKKLGYQRSFSKTRIKEIKNYINGKGIIPNSILVNIDQGKFDYQENDNLLTLEDTNSLGLIIDGQHRVNGCYDANP
ncbi:MAG: DGQHR domain-containing protein, partial [Dolichospermum sp.]